MFRCAKVVAIFRTEAKSDGVKAFVEFVIPIVSLIVGDANRAKQRGLTNGVERPSRGGNRGLEGEGFSQPNLIHGFAFVKDQDGFVGELILDGPA